MTQPEIRQGLQECADLTKQINSRPYAPTEKLVRGKILEEISAEIVGKTVRIADISDAETVEEQPIQIYKPLSALVKAHMEESDRRQTLRREPGKNYDLMPYNDWKGKRSVSGKVLGIDTEHASLVLKPAGLKTLSSTRYWVRLSDPETGVPAVDFDIIGRRTVR